MEVYRACTKCLQQKMPTKNPLLCPMSSLDPTCHKHEVTLRFTKKLPSDAPNVLTEDECEKYEVEVHNFHSDPDLPPFKQDMRLHSWLVVGV